MSDDYQQAITHVLQQDSKVLNALFAKVNQLKELDQLLHSCLDPKLAKHCKVANLNKDQLIVITNNALWATQFRFQIPTLLKQLQQKPQLAQLKGIQCKIIPVIGQKQMVSATQPMQKISLGTATTILEISKTIRHDKLREVMKKIAAHTICRVD